MQNFARHRSGSISLTPDRSPNSLPRKVCCAETKTGRTAVVRPAKRVVKRGLAKVLVDEIKRNRCVYAELVIYADARGDPP